MGKKCAVFGVAITLLFVLAGEARAEKRAMVDEFSAEGYGLAGCGLGSVLFGSQPGLIQVVASSLNMTGMQTFAIVSGTSNCLGPDDESQRAELFIEANRLALEEDVSRGGGATLASFAKVVGCKESDRLGSSLQRNFEKIFPDRVTPAKAISQSIFATINGDRELKSLCI